MSDAGSAISTTQDWVGQTHDALVQAALRRAHRQGWTWLMVRDAGADAGLTPAETELMLPEGPRDLAALLSRHLDARTLRDLAHLDPAALKVRERIREAVGAWIRAGQPHEASLRRWAGFLALPGNAPLGLRLAWASADVLWRWAGDKATDENHYTKRALLSEILISTLAIALASGEGAALAHLDRRIAGVMRFEKLKAKVQPLARAQSLAQRLGALRYGARGLGSTTLIPSPEEVEAGA